MTRWRLVLLGALAALGSLAIQIVVPALPLITSDIGAAPADGQLLISAYLVVLALGQLGWAPLADRTGRRPVMLIGLLIFIMGTVVCAAATQLAPLLAGRVVQAIGASSCLVAARAMATDGTTTGRAAAPLAILTSVVLISPAVAPVIGGTVAGVLGWRALFWLIAAVAAIASVIAVRGLRETRPGDGSAIHPLRIGARYLLVLGGNGFLGLAIANALITGGFYLFLAVSPFVLAAAGATPALSGLFYSLVASAMICGTLAVPRIAARNPASVTPTGLTLLALGGLALVATSIMGGGVGALLASMGLVALGSGISGPALLAEAIERQRDQAASVASLFGTLQMGGAALVSTAIVRAAPSATLEIGLIGALVLISVAIRHQTR